MRSRPLVTTLLLLVAMLSAAPRANAFKDGWKSVAKFSQVIGCGFFFDKDRGLVGTGVREGAIYNHIVQIYRTFDGGATWDTATIAKPIQGAVTSIWMVDTLLGYASIYADLPPGATDFGHASIWKTTDGGKTWTDPFHLDHLATCVYAQPGLIVYTCWDGGHLHYPGTDFAGGGVSYDDGATWTRMFDRGNGIAFSDSLHGVVTQINDVGQTFWVTSDAGRTWQSTTAQYEAWSVYSPPHSETFYCANESQIYLPHGEINRSLDSGRTWGQLNSFKNQMGDIRFTGTIQGKGHTLYAQSDSSYYVYDAAFDTFLLAPQNWYGMFRSDDLGANWHWVAGPSHSRDTRFCVTGCSGEVVYAFDAQGNVWKTVDGGDGTLPGGNPNDADFLAEHDTITVTPDPCGDSISIAALSPSCVPITIDSMAQISGTDLIGAPVNTVTYSVKIAKPLQLADSATGMFYYSPVRDTNSTSVVRIYGHALNRRIVRDVVVHMINHGHDRLSLSKASSTLTVSDCVPASDTIRMTGLTCDNFVIDSAQFASGEVTVLTQFPDTLSSTHTKRLILQFTPDSAGDNTYGLHLFAHHNRKIFDTVIPVHAVAQVPRLSLTMSAAALSFDTKYCRPEAFTTRLSANGCDSLIVDSVISTGTAFHLAWPMRNIAARTEDSIRVTFDPDSLGLTSGSLHVFAHSGKHRTDTVLFFAGINRGLPQSLEMSNDVLALSTQSCQPTAAKFTISNQSCDSLYLDSCKSQNHEFSLQYDPKEMRMGSNDSLHMSIAFAPDSGNTRTTQLHLYLHTSKRIFDTTVTVSGVNDIAKNPLALSSDNLYLETRYCQPVLMPVTIFNWGCHTMSIDSIVPVGDVRHEFSVLPENSRVASQSVVTDTIQFLPDTSGQRTITMHLYGTESGKARDTLISVAGRNITSPEPYLPPLDSAFAGDLIRIPIMVRPTRDPFTMKTVNMHLKFNTDILEPQRLDFGGTCIASTTSATLAPNATGASIRITATNPVADTSALAVPIAYVLCKVYLARDQNTWVELDTFVTDKEPTLQLCSVPTTYFHTALACGNAFLLDLMVHGHLSSQLLTIAPNPASRAHEWHVRYEVHEKSRELSMEVYDANGVKVGGYPAPASVGEHELHVPTPEASGDYFLMLRSDVPEDARKVSVEN